MTQPDDWSGRLVAAIAEQIKRFRQERDMSAQQLADETAKLGFLVPRSVIANLESGRRNSITVPEILVIARALQVAPLLLLFPVGQQEIFEVTPGINVTAWDAAKWFAGDADDPAQSVDPASRRVYRSPISLFRDHDTGLRSVWKARANVKMLQARVDSGENGDTVRTLDLARATLDQNEGYVRRLRDLMRSHGLNPPALAVTDAELEGLGP
jgi:transcriptional regulator with XRE-family HTH domain